MSCVIDTTTTLVTAATTYPLDVFTAKQHIRAIDDVEDDLVQAWIKAAVDEFEMETGRQIMPATWEYWLDAFPSERKIELPRPPLLSVTSVQYINADGDLVDFTDGSPAIAQWQVKAPDGVYARRGWIEPLNGVSWPIARNESGAVRIQFQAGYSDVPELFKGVLLRMVADYDRFRGGFQDRAISRLPNDHVLFMLKSTALSSQVLHRP